MKNKSFTFVAVFLAVIVVAPLAWIVYNHYYSVDELATSDEIGSLTEVGTVPLGSTVIRFPFAPKNMQPGAKFSIKECKVNDGYWFRLQLENDVFINATLSVATKDEATAVVVELLRSASPPAPTVTLLRKVGNYWVVDVRLSVDSRTVDLKDVLEKRDLLLCETKHEQAKSGDKGISRSPTVPRK